MERVKESGGEGEGEWRRGRERVHGEWMRGNRRVEEREEKIIGDRRGEGRREYRKGEGKYCRV